MLKTFDEKNPSQNHLARNNNSKRKHTSSDLVSNFEKDLIVSETRNNRLSDYKKVTMPLQFGILESEAIVETKEDPSSIHSQ